ncbi:MAG: Eco57I restriction-modification methylase domain-containing protein [Leptospirales bacterium]
MKGANTEEELRAKAAIPGVPLSSLRFVKENGAWTPASGTFPAWPDQLKDLKVLDPCCGSGHFLVAVFLMLVPMRMAEEGMSSREAVDAVLNQNLYGLELDRRCVELAAFALALSAWRYPDAGGYRALPEIHIACSGLAVTSKKEEWIDLGKGDTNLQIILEGLYHQFTNAPVLGSLIDPGTKGVVKIFWQRNDGQVSSILAAALVGEKSDERIETGVVAQGVVKAASILSSRYHLVVTNVPYLGSGDQGQILKVFFQKNYPEAKRDLATVFLERCLKLCTEGGTTSIVLPQNWLFLTSYKKFREKLLKSDTWNLIARLGPGAFETPMWDFNVQLIILSRGNPDRGQTLLGNEGAEHRIRGLDVSELRKAAEKASGILTAEIKEVSQEGQLQNPDARVMLVEEEGESGGLLVEYARSHHGLVCGDRPRMAINFWELVNSDIWIPYCGTVDSSCFYGGKETYLRWNGGTGPIKELKGATNLETNAWENHGVVISAMRSLFTSLYTGMGFDNNTAVIVPQNPAHLPAIWCFCSSPEYNEAVRSIDQSLKVTNATLVKVPFDLDRWTAVAAEKYPNGLPKPYSNDPTQWIFHGHPCGGVEWDEEKKRTVSGKLRIDETVLQVAVSRLLGYRWPAELDPGMELAPEQREWVKQSETLLPLSSSGGIVCIPPVCGDTGASDRLLNILAVAYGKDWSNDILLQLLSASDNAGKSLERWLRDKFFLQHCRLFHHRPFIWQIWDGLNDGFSALVNYHQLDFKKMEALTYSYLGDWISRQRQNVDQKVEGAVEKLAAAEGLKKKLELILQGEKPYDIFVRWKSIEKQPIGWHPDINDGVRLNIRPFMTAGVLRFNKKPQVNISWETDRGNDVKTAPWFSVFGGKRINDHHLSLEEKRIAREEITRKDNAQ